MLDLIDGVRELLSDGLDMTTDDSAERPFDWETGKLYVWEETSDQRSIGTGEIREDFTIIAAIATDSSEEAESKRSRETSDRLYGYRDEFLLRIRLNSNVGPWQSGFIAGGSIPGYLRQLDLRGIAVRITGYRLVG